MQSTRAAGEQQRDYTVIGIFPWPSTCLLDWAIRRSALEVKGRHLAGTGVGDIIIIPQILTFADKVRDAVLASIEAPA